MRFKRLNIGLIFVLSLLAFAACGSGDGSGEATQPADSEVSPAPVATTAPLDQPAADEPAADDGAADETSASNDADATAAAGSQDTAEGTRSGIASALWGDNVTIAMDDGSFRFTSDGLPNHELPDQFLVPKEGNMPPFSGDDIAGEFEIRDTDELMVASPLDIEITLDPVYSEEVTQNSLSTIGVMISGAALFNDYEDQTRENVALDDNLSLDGVFFIDACNGHPLASGESYHYHGVPYCITDQVDVAGQHSTIIGVLLDGFPIYGPQDVDGSLLTNADLDECSGHVGVTPEFPEGIYHYHLTEDANPYSIDCFHGVIDYASNAGGPPGGDGPPGGERPDGPPPGDGEGPPADAAGAPADGEGPPADAAGAPADGEGPPADGEGPPADGEGPPATDGDSPSRISGAA